jgi:hypothetical protein
MNEHLVAYEYGAGRVWGLVEAPSMGAVRDALPELEIYARVPEWMLPSDLDEIRSRALVSISDANPVDSIFEAARRRTLT